MNTSVRASRRVRGSASELPEALTLGLALLATWLTTHGVLNLRAPEFFCMSVSVCGVMCVLLIAGVSRVISYTQSATASDGRDRRAGRMLPWLAALTFVLILMLGLGGLSAAAWAEVRFPLAWLAPGVLLLTAMAWFVCAGGE